MSYYSNKPESVRVDFFKPSGKWYTTMALDWQGDWEEDCIHESFRQTLIKSLNGSYQGMTAVCLQPYHKHEHPLMQVVEC